MYDANEEILRGWCLIVIRLKDIWKCNSNYFSLKKLSK